MKAVITILTVLAMASVVQSCSIRSSQVASLIAAFQEPSVDLKDHSWTMNYGNYSTTVYAISNPNGTLFSNQFGDKVFFDGWSMTEINGLGINRANWKVVDNNNSRMFIRGNILVGEHLCKPWRSVKRSNMVRFNQECRSFASYSNVIMTDDKGYITFIRQAVTGADTFLTLNKN
jgi:hypothetical protein